MAVMTRRVQTTRLRDIVSRRSIPQRSSISNDRQPNRNKQVDTPTTCPSRPFGMQPSEKSMNLEPRCFLRLFHQPEYSFASLLYIAAPASIVSREQVTKDDFGRECHTYLTTVAQPVSSSSCCVVVFEILGRLRLADDLLRRRADAARDGSGPPAVIR